MQSENIMEFPKIPYNQEGFTVSFNIDNFDPKQVNYFYRTFGFVVFDDVVNEEEAEKTIDELWDDVQTRCGKEHDRRDSSTWTLKGLRGKHGFVTGKPIHTHQCSLNRQNPKVYKAFKALYELSSQKVLNQPLIASFDRASAMPPAKINIDWLTNPIYHFDINPWWWTNVVYSTSKNWKKNNQYKPQNFEKWLGEGCKMPFVGYTKLAGVLALTDTNELSGGFECVPGFQNHIKKWCETTPYGTPIEKDPVLMKSFQKIFLKKRSMLVFSRELPHNIYQNLSQNFRFAQYLRMSPQSALVLTEFDKQCRKKCIQHVLPKNLPVNDPISKEIYMLD